MHSMYVHGVAYLVTPTVHLLDACVRIALPVRCGVVVVGEWFRALGWRRRGLASLPPKVQHLLRHCVPPFLCQHVRVVRDGEMRQVDEPRHVVRSGRPLEAPSLQKKQVLPGVCVCWGGGGGGARGGVRV